MKANVLFVIIFLCSILLSCCKENVQKKNEALYQKMHTQFNGKYKIVSSRAEGKNLLDAEPEFKKAILEIIVIRPVEYQQEDRFQEGYVFLITHWWPDPQPIPNYRKNSPESVNDYYHSMSKNLSLVGILFFATLNNAEFVFEPNQIKEATPFFLTQPEKITLLSKDRIMVEVIKGVVTSNGIRLVKITNIFEKYTSVT